MTSGANAKYIIVSVGLIFMCSGMLTYVLLSKNTAASVLSVRPRVAGAGPVAVPGGQGRGWGQGGAPPVDTTNLPLCPEMPPGLKSNVQPEERQKALDEDSTVLSHVQFGGTYQPRDCKAREHVAIITPYRDRPEHLRRFLVHMHQYLKTQQLHYTIFVAEMAGNGTFNTGMMQNIGFMAAAKTANFSCYVIHDVDLLPTNENNLYRCDDKTAVHLAVNNSKYKYRKLYAGYFGGAVALTKSQYYKANGFSNLFFGWGSQDDDFKARVMASGVKFRDVPMSVGVYEAMPHDRDKGNPVNMGSAKFKRTSAQRMNQEGLNTLDYKTLKQEPTDLYTWTLAEIDQDKVMEKWK